MDYYDFFGGRKQVISQDGHNRLILVRYKKDLILIDEYECFGVYKERCRMRMTKEQIRKLNEIV